MSRGGEGSGRKGREARGNKMRVGEGRGVKFREIRVRRVFRSNEVTTRCDDVGGVREEG